MKPIRIWAVARKEFIHVFRDPRSLGMAIAIPMLLLVLFGYALKLDVDNVPLVVWDRSESHASSEFISRFDGSAYFSIKEYVRTYPEVVHAIDSAQALVALVIPEDFARRIDSGRTAAVQLIVDGSDSNTATIAMGYADAIASAFSQDVALREVRRTGARDLQVPTDLRLRTWYNQDMESKNYIIPGLIAVIMMVIAALLTSLTVAREWESGTMEQLISTPVKGSELILGKFIPYFVIGMFDVLMSVLTGEFIFNVPLRGSVILLFGMAAVFLTGALSMGMVISILARGQLLASQLAMVLTFLPSFLLSDFMYAISNMPRPIQMMTYLIPARYFVVLLKGIYLKGTGLQILWTEGLLLVVFSVLMVVWANLKFKKKLV